MQIHVRSKYKINVRKKKQGDKYLSHSNTELNKINSALLQVISEFTLKKIRNPEVKQKVLCQVVQNTVNANPGLIFLSKNVFHCSRFV